MSFQRAKTYFLIVIFLAGLGLSVPKALAGGPTAKGNPNNEYALEAYLFNLYNQQKQDQFNQLPKPEQSPPRVLPPG